MDKEIESVIKKLHLMDKFDRKMIKKSIKRMAEEGDDAVRWVNDDVPANVVFSIGNMGFQKCSILDKILDYESSKQISKQKGDEIWQKVNKLYRLQENKITKALEKKLKDVV
jgi:hypothetical protein